MPLMNDVAIYFSRYQEYKSEYITTQKRAYFNTHKDAEWYVFFPTAEISIDSWNILFCRV